jgi:hypothetical protein
MSYTFPWKVGLYLRSGVQIFFHGPSYSSFYRFRNRYMVGSVCNSLDQIEIKKEINKILMVKNITILFVIIVQRPFTQDLVARCFTKKLLD